MLVVLAAAAAAAAAAKGEHRSLSRDTLATMGLPVRPLSSPVPDPVIVGGQPAPEGAYNYVTSHGCACGNYIGLDCAETQFHFCGGSVLYKGDEEGINTGWVLTAAHCVCPDFATRLGFAKSKVLVGATDLTNSGTEYDVADVFCHPDYDAPTLDNDFALVKLTQSIAIDVDKVVLGRVPESGTTVRLSGWGNTLADGTASPTEMLTAEFQVIENDECNEQLGFVTDNMVCANTDGSAICFGDSGSPLVKEDADGSATQIGIASWLIDAGDDMPCNPDSPFASGYARVEAAFDWIDAVVSGTFDRVKPEGRRHVVIGEATEFGVPQEAATIRFKPGMFTLVLTTDCSRDFDIFVADIEGVILFGSERLNAVEELVIEITGEPGSFLDLKIMVAAYTDLGGYELTVLGIEDSATFKVLDTADGFGLPIPNSIPISLALFVAIVVAIIEIIRRQA